MTNRVSSVFSLGDEWCTPFILRASYNAYPIGPGPSYVLPLFFCDDAVDLETAGLPTAFLLTDSQHFPCFPHENTTLTIPGRYFRDVQQWAAASSKRLKAWKYNH